MGWEFEYRIQHTNYGTVKLYTYHYVYNKILIAQCVQFCLLITATHTCSTLLIAIDNITQSVKFALLCNYYYLLLLLFVYNQIPPQSEENNKLYKRAEIKY